MRRAFADIVAFRSAKGFLYSRNPFAGAKGDIGLARKMAPLPGNKQHRQKTYDDFIAAAEYLTAEKFTRPAKLAIHDSSNGRLLVGACILQRPELFAARLPDVGTMDIIRFHKFGVGPYIESNVGSPEDPDEFKAPRAISPYYNLKRGVNAVLHAASGLFSGAARKLFQEIWTRGRRTRHYS